MDFIELFAGVGGFRLGFEAAGFRCVFASEIDKAAADTYHKNFGERPAGDITRIRTEDIPHHAVLTGGFPCQPFSAGGKKKGLEDPRGGLIFEIERILKAKRPAAFVLENVRNLTSLQGGRVFARVLDVLNGCGYSVQWRIMDAAFYGVPQFRKRVFLVGFADWAAGGSFVWPEPSPEPCKDLPAMLEKNPPAHRWLTQKRADGLIRHRARHEAKGHGFGFRTITETANTLTCSGSGLEQNVLETGITKPGLNKEGYRFLTPREFARLQGFPDSFELADSQTAAYKQFGNAVAVPVVAALAKAVYNYLKPLEILI